MRPTQDRVLVEILEDQTRTEAGLYLPHADHEMPQRIVRGKILDVGPGRITDRGVLIEPRVRKGEVVMFQAFAPDAVVTALGVKKRPKELSTGDRALLKEGDCLAVIE